MSKAEETGRIETLYHFFLLGMSKAVTYVVLLVLANYFILPDYGKASFVMSVFRAAALFGSVGLPFIFVPWIIKKKDTSSIFYFILLFNLLITAVGVIIGINYPWILPIVFVIPLMALSGISNSILRVKHNYHIIQFLGMMLEVYALIAIFLFAKYGKAGIIAGHSVSFYLTTFTFIWLTRKELWSMAKIFRLNFKVIWSYLSKGTITTLLYLSFAFLNWIDSIILGYLSTFEEVARYNIAGPVSNLLAIIPFSLSMFLLTRESEVKNKKSSDLILKRAMRISFSFSFIIAMFMLSLIFPLIKIFFSQYVGIEFYILVLSAGILFYSLYSLIYIYQTSKLQPEKAFWPIAIAALINLVLDIVLIPKYGLMGIVSATTIAHTYAFVTLAYKMELLKEFLAVFPILLFLPVCYYLGLVGLILIPFAFGALYLVGLIKEGDLFIVSKTIFQIFEKLR